MSAAALRVSVRIHQTIAGNVRIAVARCLNALLYCQFTPSAVAWNKYYIIVSNRDKTDFHKLARLLRLETFRPAGQVDLLATNKSDDLFIGTLGTDLLILVNPALSAEFFSETPTRFQNEFTALFPNAEIAVLHENSTVGCYGYAIIRDGKRVRMKDGCDGETYHDQGDLLPEEQKLLSQPLFDELELQEMRTERSEEDVQAAIQFEASWRTPAEISKKYFGAIIDNLDPKAISLTRYKN